ncbi:MAG: DUF4065 domain-containing protein, partial [Methylobacter sp.]|nr:DUF4065 domain-containing protein [Methylobacter sp.]
MSSINNTININDLCDYIIIKSNEAGSSLSNLKLQKLAYYADAWYLAFFGEKLVDCDFEAWIHGPVSRELYNRFAPNKSLYSDITIEDSRQNFDIVSIGDNVEHIDKILEAYGKFSGAQLEEMAHREEPW